MTSTLSSPTLSPVPRRSPLRRAFRQSGACGRRLLLRPRGNNAYAILRGMLVSRIPAPATDPDDKNRRQTVNQIEHDLCRQVGNHSCKNRKRK